MKDISLGDYLKTLRSKKGYSLRQVQDITGVSASYLNRLETGKRQNPTSLMISKLAKCYEINAEVIFHKIINL